MGFFDSLAAWLRGLGGKPADVEGDETPALPDDPHAAFAFLLRRELEQDPAALGYAELLAAQRDRDLAELMNRQGRAAAVFGPEVVVTQQQIEDLFRAERIAAYEAGQAAIRAKAAEILADDPEWAALQGESADANQRSLKERAALQQADEELRRGE